MKIFSGFVTSLVFLLAVSQAWAVSGWLQGRHRLQSSQGNFCDTSIGMDCTAARFPAAQGDGGISAYKYAKLQIWRIDSNGNRVGSNPIGASYTDLAGNYTVQWTHTSTPPNVRLELWFCDKDDRFCVKNENDQLWYMVLHANVVPVANFTVQLGSWIKNNSSISNVYDAASRTWEEALRYSSDIRATFTEVKLLFPYTPFDSGPNPSADASGPVKRIRLNSTRDQVPMTVSHEMGHIASYLLKNHQYCGLASAGFEETNAMCVAFEEGLAEYIGLVSYYWDFAPQPIMCRSTTACGALDTTPPKSNYGIEASTGVANCVVGEQGWLLSATRFLWDIYDDQDDPVWSDAQHWSYETIADELTTWPSGTGEKQADEAWNAAKTMVDDPDGRSSWDYMDLWAPVSLNSQYIHNCSPGVVE